ncbi:MAG: RidA family protein [Chitinophagales bacterium]|jgi:2-iminobutanoate/2-iminopropanoate deaminase|nr:RidA family protein [Chitinophagales bacterium]
MKKSIFTPNAPAAIGPYSQAVEYNGLILLSGQIAINPKTGEIEAQDVVAQTHQVMKNIEAILTEAGISWGHVLKSSIFIKDMNDFTKINEVYSSYLIEPYPARETVEVARLPKDVLVEISITAHR